MFSIARPVKIPEQIDLRPSMPPVYDQGNLGSCTANAIAAAFDFGRHKQGKAFLTPSRLFIYYLEREMEHSIAYDSGAMLRDGIKVATRQGVCPETMWPYDETKFILCPPKDCYQAALDNQVLSYSRLTSSLNTTLTCLAMGYPFVFGFTVYESFESEAVASTGEVTMPGLNESAIGGHAVVAVGFSLTKRAVLVRNSWGTDWGSNGYFWMPFDYITTLASDRWQIKLVE